MGLAVHRKVLSKSGGLTIPAEYRREYDFLGGQAVDITVEDGRLVIGQHTPRCGFCGSAEEIIKHMGHHVCRACVTAMAKDVVSNG